MKKNKTYIALSVFLSDVPEKHLGNNRCRQFSVLCRTSSKKKLAELTKTSLYTLNTMGCQETTDRKHIEVCQNPDTIYYFMDNLNPLGKEDYLKWIEMVNFKKNT